MGENTAVPPLPGRLRSILDLTRVLPSAARSVRKLSAAKRKYQRKEKADPDAPPPSAPANHRAAAALGQLDTAVPRAYRLPGPLLCQPAESFVSLPLGLMSGGFEAQLCVAN